MSHLINTVITSDNTVEVQPGRWFMGELKVTSRRTISDETVEILRDLNPWWATGKLRKAAPP